jgi:hypothetical protein
MMRHFDIPPCKVSFTETSDGGDFDCEYEDMEYSCDQCICVTSQFDDYSGIDPRTNEEFIK